MSEKDNMIDLPATVDPLKSENVSLKDENARLRKAVKVLGDYAVSSPRTIVSVPTSDGLHSLEIQLVGTVELKPGDVALLKRIVDALAAHVAEAAPVMPSVTA
jgi:hypothetical protein